MGTAKCQRERKMGCLQRKIQVSAQLEKVFGKKSDDGLTRTQSMFVEIDRHTLGELSLIPNSA